ncbi:iron ABC transporter permease [Myceligenerans pegani]|uniref:Iron ABC transporter permease n=1 Tax=Myceligenerans pegani TaxID=2776917 RepID=A0ABR9N439_9MICO|nr:iron ABC transporter permease [Myceligenerans sp. TRM 65318]MBE1878428.1 iron ABC transporter permease [Myceligenerans sp. TRM 65318]MBE3020699.1 iron ABC transporter permease [Myceligenerans sp. TRM 65318]
MSDGVTQQLTRPVGEPSPGRTTGPRAVPTRPGPAPTTTRSRWAAAGAILAVLAWLAGAVVVHLTQGTADLDLAGLWQVLTGQAAGTDGAVLAQSRLPRLLAALVVGSALGAAGATMQGVARNPLASPDTTAVNAGAYLALTILAVTGIPLGLFGSATVAFAGGLAAASLVIAVSAGTQVSAIRLVLAGSALTLGLSAVTSVLLVLFPWQTQGMFAWGAGSLAQNGAAAVTALAPVVVAGILAVVLLGRRLDLLQLGDDAARSLGIAVGRTRIALVALAVLLATSAVTLAGPIGFVGLCAPVLMRLLARAIPPLRRHRVLIPVSAVAGIALVLTADVAVREMFGAVQGVTLPTGVATTILGAVFMVALAQRMRTGLAGEALASLRSGTTIGRRAPWLLVLGTLVLLVGAGTAGILLGDSTVLLGDVANWLRGAASVRIEVILETRVPRMAAALTAGAALALAGALVQAVTRNPLADPGILGISASAGLGAVVTIVAGASVGFATTLGGALAGASMATIALFVLGARGGADQGRLVLVGVGIGAAASALTTLLLVRTDPWNQNAAVTWLGGSTYGATFGSLVPTLVVLAVCAVTLSAWHRELDLVQLDETTPRSLGVNVPGLRRGALFLAVLLTAAATAGVGVIAFVGLVAPHAARLVVGKRHALLLPLAALLGALLVVTADIVGRVVLAPDQLPAGLVTAAIGTPYFIWLLWHMRARRS